MAVNWQEIVTLLIVAIAAAAVVRRVYAQFAAFRKSASDASISGEASACSGCEGCGPRQAMKQQLVNISLSAPQRIRPSRPISGGAHGSSHRN